MNRVVCGLVAAAVSLIPMAVQGTGKVPVPKPVVKGDRVEPQRDRSVRERNAFLLGVGALIGVSLWVSEDRKEEVKVVPVPDATGVGVKYEKRF